MPPPLATVGGGLFTVVGAGSDRMVVGWEACWVGVELVVVAGGWGFGFRFAGVACWLLVGVPRRLWRGAADVPAPALLAQPAVAIATAIPVRRARFNRSAWMGKG